MVPNGDLQVGFLKTFVINQHLNDRKLEIDREEFEYRRNNMRLIFNGIELKDDEKKINEIFTTSEEDKVHCGIAVIPRVLSTKQEEKDEKEEKIPDKTTEQKEEKEEEEKTDTTMTESDLANLQQLQIQALSQIDQWRQRAQYFEIIDPTESARARSLSRDWENRLSELNNIAWASYHQMMSGMMPDSVITNNNNNTTVENQQQETPVENGENNRRFAYQILIFIDIRLLLKLGLLVLILSQDGGKERMLFLIACACIVYMYQTRLFELLFRGRIGNDENAAQQQQQQEQAQQQQQQVQEEEPSIFSTRGITEHFRSHFIAGVIRRNTDEWWERIYDLAYIVLGFALSFLPMWRPHVSEDDEIPFVPVAAPEQDGEEKVDETEEKVDETEEEKVGETEEKVDETEEKVDETEPLLPDENNDDTGLRRRRPHHNDSF